MSASFGFLSSFPPTQCGLATFTAALQAEIAAAGHGTGIVRVLERPAPGTGSAVVHHMVHGERGAVERSAAALNAFDVVVVQHEYGIYGGVDGDEGHRSTRSTPTVLRLSFFTQFLCIRRLTNAWCSWDRLRLGRPCRRDGRDGEAIVCLALYEIGDADVVTIPHGASLLPTMGSAQRRPACERVPAAAHVGPPRTGQGHRAHHRRSGRCSAICVPRPRYTVAGVTHPKGVRAAHGETDTGALADRTGSGLGSSLGRGHLRRHLGRNLTQLTTIRRIGRRGVLPYDSADQVTSGVLVDAVAAGRPVVATAFPHAVELLHGAGIVVPHADPRAWARRLDAKCASRHCRRDGRPSRRGGTRSAGRPSPSKTSNFDRGRNGGRHARSRVIAARPPFTHINRLSDGRRLFEHTDRPIPRTKHGYCLDDDTRLLMVLSASRTEDVCSSTDGRLLLLSFTHRPATGVPQSHGPGGHWPDDWPPTTGGVGLCSLGTAAAPSPRPRRSVAPAQLRSGGLDHSPVPAGDGVRRAGAAEMLFVDPHRAPARLLVDAVRSIGRPSGIWPWPEPRLAYANAAIRRGR